MATKTLTDRTFAIFSRMNDWLPKDTVDALRAACLDEADATAFAMKFGPANYERWSRDIRVISETLEILDLKLVE
jgi:hypothetical protein